MTSSRHNSNEALENAFPAEILRGWLYGRFGKRVTWLTARTVSHAVTKPYRDHIGRLDAAISWVEAPFVDEATSFDELKARVRILLEDTRRARAAFLAATNASEGRER